MMTLMMHSNVFLLESPHKIESDSTIQQIVVADINRSDGNLDFSSVKLLPKESTDDMVAVVA